MNSTSIVDHPSAVTHHDYVLNFGDKWLALLKKMVRNPETRHQSLELLAALQNKWPIRRQADRALNKSIRFADRSLPLSLSSPIILAAGANKYGNHLPDFAALGFGGITVGSATAAAREGNAFRPRIRMLEEERAMQNAMGLNNPGIDVLAKLVDLNLELCHRRGMAVGISVADTPGLTDENAIIAETVSTFRKAYSAADYIEINLSCPNTGSDRLDSDPGFLQTLLQEIMEVRRNLVPRKAVLVKLSPDMNARALDNVLRIVSDTGITGVVLFNTFPADKSRFLKLKTTTDELLPVAADGRKGGLSGRPLYKNTLPAVRHIRQALPKTAIFASGGVDHGAKIWDLLEAGADAVQVYTVVAYRWNAAWKLQKELLEAMRARGVTRLDESD
jgi:dihydroorotate dehydrogenase